jgi:hypothetical protein
MITSAPEGYASLCAIAVVRFDRVGSVGYERKLEKRSRFGAAIEPDFNLITEGVGQ